VLENKGRRAWAGGAVEPLASGPVSGLADSLPDAVYLGLVLAGRACNAVVPRSLAGLQAHADPDLDAYRAT
jgi:hypothetical protein